MLNLSMHLFGCLPTCLPVSIYMCLSRHLFLSLSLPIYVSTCLCLLTCLCIYLCICLIYVPLPIRIYLSTLTVKILTWKPTFFFSPASMSCMCWSRSLAVAMAADFALLCSSFAVDSACDVLKNWLLTADSSDLTMNNILQILLVSWSYAIFTDTPGFLKLYLIGTLGFLKLWCNSLHTPLVSWSCDIVLLQTPLVSWSYDQVHCSKFMNKWTA